MKSCKGKMNSTSSTMSLGTCAGQQAIHKVVILEA